MDNWLGNVFKQGLGPHLNKKDMLFVGKRVAIVSSSRCEQAGYTKKKKNGRAILRKCSCAVWCCGVGGERCV